MEITPDTFPLKLNQHRIETTQKFLVKSLIGGLAGATLQLIRRKRLMRGFLFWGGFLGATEVQEYYKTKKELKRVYLPKPEPLFDYIPEEK